MDFVLKILLSVPAIHYLGLILSWNVGDIHLAPFVLAGPGPVSQQVLQYRVGCGVYLGAARYGLVGFGLVHCCMFWHSVVWHFVAWYGMVWCGIVCKCRYCTGVVCKCGMQMQLGAATRGGNMCCHCE